MRSIPRWGGVVIAAMYVLAAIVAFDELHWRAEVILLRARGEITDISWAELLPMLKPGSPIYLGSLSRTRNVYASIANPWTRPEDIEAGRTLFQAQCATCHGPHGQGEAGPALVGGMGIANTSDWAVFRTIRDGIPGTSMSPKRFSDQQTWQLVAYIRTLDTPGPDALRSPAARSLAYPTVSAERLSGGNNREPGSWLTYSGNHAGHRHSPLNQINASNVRNLQLIWSFQTGAAEFLEVTPLVNGRYFFITVPPDSVVALDAFTGDILWRTRWPMPNGLRVCCGAKNRGVALAGESLYVGTLDARLRALEAKSGRLQWDVVLADFEKGYSVTSAPLVVKDLVVVGVSGGVLGIRGFLDAYDGRTGKRRWRFHTVPERGQPGAESWTGNAWKTGGAAPWMTGAYDPELDLIYWGVGNPSPVYNGEARPGDNLFSDSALALDPDDGTLRWHFQFTPHDVHDMDAAQTPILFDAEFAGRPRRLMLWPNRNGFYYVLDRATGEFLLARPFARQTWAESIDSRGRPIIRQSAQPSPQGTLSYPSPAGATNWWSSSLDAVRGLVYVPVLDRGMFYFTGPVHYQVGELFLGGSFAAPADASHTTSVVALHFASGEIAWQRELHRRDWLAGIGGILSTAGGLVFVGDDREFFALDADTGEILWRAGLGGPIMAAPISYTVDGHQRISIAAGSSIFTFGLPAE